MNKYDLLKKFFHKSWPDKKTSVHFVLRSMGNRLLKSFLLPIHLPYGGWWLGAIDGCRDAIVERRFEEAEWRFVRSFLRKGMTFVDIGAHHGFYTILAAKAVGSEGCVIAFEPSPRERRRLVANLRLNRCKKVKVEPFAASGEEGEAPFFVVGGRQTAFNSLRPPAVSAPTQKIMVKTLTLDDYLENHRVQRLDFVKIDAEGAELEILMGAQKSLGQKFKPLIMIEASDLRTSEWGYQSCKLRDTLSGFGYSWFTVGPEGRLQPYCNGTDQYNFIAIPEEKLKVVDALMPPIEDR